MRVSAGLTICRPLAKSLFAVQSSGSLAERIPITLSYTHIVNVVNTHAWYVGRRIMPGRRIWRMKIYRALHALFAVPPRVCLRDTIGDTGVDADVGWGRR